VPRDVRAAIDAQFSVVEPPALPAPAAEPVANFSDVFDD
jgi:hypothetical protein